MIMHITGKPVNRRHAFVPGRTLGRTRLEIILIAAAGVLLCFGVFFFVLYMNNRGQAPDLAAESGAESSEANVVGTS